VHPEHVDQQLSAAVETVIAMPTGKVKVVPDKVDFRAIKRPSKDKGPETSVKEPKVFIVTATNSSAQSVPQKFCLTLPEGSVTLPQTISLSSLENLALTLGQDIKVEIPENVVLTGDLG
jgi:hypothetical protein